MCLVSGRSTFRGLATTHGLSPSAVRRLRTDHMPEVLTRAKSLHDIATADSLAEHVRALRARTVTILIRAEASGDTKSELAALRELRALVELETRGTDRDSTVIHISIVQQYVHRVIEIMREFVPPDRVDFAIAKIDAALQSDAGERLFESPGGS